MGQRTRASCRNCGGHRSVVGEISWDGNCRPCGERLLVDNIVGIATKTGVPYRRQVVGMVAAVVKDPRIVAALDRAGVFPTVDDVGLGR